MFTEGYFTLKKLNVHFLVPYNVPNLQDDYFGFPPTDSCAKYLAKSFHLPAFGAKIRHFFLDDPEKSNVNANSSKQSASVFSNFPL